MSAIIQTSTQPSGILTPHISNKVLQLFMLTHHSNLFTLLKTNAVDLRSRLVTNIRMQGHLVTTDESGDYFLFLL